MNRVRTTTDRFRAVGTNALQLCGICSLEGGPLPRLPDGGVVEFRDLAALVRTVPFTALEPRVPDVAAYRAIIEATFAQRCVLPAPYGTIFRSRESLIEWMELHYFTLADTVRFIEDRLMARVRVSPGLANVEWGSVIPGTTETHEAPPREREFEVTAFDSFRVLKKEAVAYVTLTKPHDGLGDIAEASFLIDRERWSAFANVVKDEQRRLPDLRIEQTGPWPPYDFVRLELHG
jgi:hypothetical protein